MSTSSCTLSILLPTLDEASWVVHAVRTARASVRAAGVDAEIIVCDGGSHDETVQRARQWADGVVECPRGRAGQLNAAARHARGDIVVMLHADSLLEPAAVGAIVEAIDAGADGGWFQIDILSERQSWTSIYGLAVMGWGINLRTRLFCTATADQCIFCRRQLFEALGGLPEVGLMEGNVFARALRDQGEVAILAPHLHISGRRWENNGLLRTMLVMYAIRLAHRAGVSTDRLATIWRQLTD